MTWLPESGLVLNLLGDLEDEDSVSESPGAIVENPEPDERVSVIHGHADGQFVTLFDCVISRMHTYGLPFAGETRNQEIQPATAIFGAHVLDQHVARFSTARLVVRGAPAWSAETTIRDLRDGDGGPVRSGFAFSWPNTPTEARADAIRLTLDHTVIRSPVRPLAGWYEAALRDVVHFGLHPDEPLTIGGFSDPCRAVVDLISLATGGGAAVLLHELAVDIEANSNGGPPDRRWLKLFQNVGDLSRSHEPARASNLLFSLADLEFATAVPAWFAVRARFRATCQMLFSLRYGPGTYVESEVATVVTAAEALADALDETPRPFDTQAFAELCRTALNAVPDDAVERIEGMLSNRATLRDRLTSLFRRLPAEVSELLMPDGDAWARNAAKARNAVSHGDTSSKYAQIDVLAAVRHTTEAVVVMNLLLELGLSASAMRRLLEPHGSLSFASTLTPNFVRTGGSGTGTAGPSS